MSWARRFGASCHHHEIKFLPRSLASTSSSLASSYPTLQATSIPMLAKNRCLISSKFGPRGRAQLLSNSCAASLVNIVDSSRDQQDMSTSDTNNRYTIQFSDATIPNNAIQSLMLRAPSLFWCSTAMASRYLQKSQEHHRFKVHHPALFANSIRFYSKQSREEKEETNERTNLETSVNSNQNSKDHTVSTANSSSSTQQQQQQQQQQLIPTASAKPSEPSIHNISYLPKSLHPYAHLARLDKPIGTFLLLHPCLWSTALATTPLGLSNTPDLKLCALFATGSFIMRGAGCTINDMWDSNIDANVERTKSRPLASGELTYPQAWTFLALQLSAGLGVLLSLPHLEECFVWGVASLPLVATYPLMKRYTNYPQLVLGLTFNWGAIMGWVAVRGEVDWSVVGPLYASGVAWTLVYDTLYAHQDKKDDEKLGLKSTALTFGEHGTKPILAALACVTWGGWMMAGYNCGFGEVLDVPYYYAGVSAAASHLLWQIYTADLNDGENLSYRFRSNNLVGWLVFGSCVAGNAMAG